jgi:hypothetical protein
MSAVGANASSSHGKVVDDRNGFVARRAGEHSMALREPGRWMSSPPGGW